MLSAYPAWSNEASSPSLFPAEVTQRLDRTIAEALIAHNLPSAAVDVAIPGKGQYVFVGGAADLQTGAPRNEHQPFRVASLTKTFVATAVLQLVDRGRLQTSDVLAKWYPNFPNADKITVDDLLRMRSGIAAPSDEQILDAIYDDPTGPAPSLADLMAQSAALEAEFISPDQKGVYTNLNYFILGGIVRQITGADVGIFITENIIDRLQLHQTSYPTSFSLPGGLHGYGLDAQTHQFADKTLFNPALGGPAGAMISSLADLRQYVRVLCVGGLLKPETQKRRLQGRALAGTTTEYGEGVITGPGACGHSGTTRASTLTCITFPRSTRP
jgi:D-alanyl-D-alanine carboxypeptidase